MDSLKEFLLPKRFSLYGYIVAVYNVLAGVIVTFITGIRSTERRQFQCNTHGIHADKDFLKTNCFNQYSQEYNASLPLYGFAFITFTSLVIICIIYSWCCVKSRVEQIEQELCATNQDNPQPTIPITTRRIFPLYLVQLLMRFGFGAFFAMLQLTGLYASNFPTQFHCKWNAKGTKNANFNETISNSSSVLNIINCQNSFATEKTTWANVIWILHIIFASLVLFEVFYLLIKARQNKTFMKDSIFCQRHIFNNRRIPLSQRDLNLLRIPILDQTEYLEPLIPTDPSEVDNRTAIDDVYVELVMHTGRVTHDLNMSKNRHELLDVYLKPPENSVKINNTNELFDSSDKSYRNILVIGRPGIGKTSLCTKIIRDWCKDKYNRFKYVSLFRFLHLNEERHNKMSLMQFFDEAEHSMNIDKAFSQNIDENAKEMLFIFDGLDEYKHRENLMKDQSKFSGKNGLRDEMPVSALYAKLLQKKLLPEATILTTSRPNAMDSLKILSAPFDRVAEILGFTPEKVESYINKFCRGNTISAKKIWQHVKSNVNLLYLCYIPVTCWIVCSMLDKFIANHILVLPTTLTDIYKGALRLFLFKHNPEYRQQICINDYTNNTFSSTIEDILSRLGKLARKGLEEKRLVFEREEVEGLENCGLLNCMPSKEKPTFGYVRAPQYCFIHLTLQEFCAAREIAKKDQNDELIHFLKSKAGDANWHLVIQFLAGLLQEHALKVSTCFEDILCQSLIRNNDKRLGLLMFKCIYELSDQGAAVNAAKRIESEKEFSGEIDLSFCDVTPPDCIAIVCVLQHCVTNLYSLDTRGNRVGPNGCSEFVNMFLTGNCHLTQLNLNGNEITDQGVVHLIDALKSEKCHLTQLQLSWNQITDQSVLYLSNAIKSKNCHLTLLTLVKNKITDQGVLHLSKALKSGNCRLTQLNLSDNEITDQGVSHLSDALKSGNCNLTQLDLTKKIININRITDQGVLHLSDALKSENCHLTQMNLSGNEITDEGVLHLSDALKSENCHLTQMNLSGNEITDQGVLHLRDALKSENCHLTLLVLSRNKITDQGVLHLSDLMQQINTFSSRDYLNIIVKTAIC